MALNLNHRSYSRLDMTSLQQVAQFVPRVFNHQDCHHNGCVNHWFTKEGLSVQRSQIRCVSASNRLETERRTVFPLFHWSEISWSTKLLARWIYEKMEVAMINKMELNMTYFFFFFFYLSEDAFHTWHTWHNGLPRKSTAIDSTHPQ